MKNLVFLDAGHGGLTDNGNYTTWPSKQVSFKKNPVPGSPLIYERDGVFYFYEGVFNRLMADKIANKLDQLKVPYLKVYDEVQDTPLQTRVYLERLGNKAVTQTLYLSLHANAWKPNRARGVEVYTSIGETPSDIVATHYIGALIDILKTLNISIPFRMDTFDADPDKEKNFFVVRETFGSAILIEHGFMDHIDDIRLLCDPEYQEACAWAAAMTVVWFFNRPSPDVLVTSELVRLPPKPLHPDKEP